MIPSGFEYHRLVLCRKRSHFWRNWARRRVRWRWPQPDPGYEDRLSAPEHLIDLAGVSGLKGIRQEPGHIVIGAMTTQYEISGSPLLAEPCPSCERRLFRSVIHKSAT